MGRAPCCDKASVKRGPWSPEEDQALRSHIQRHGTGGNWIALPRKAGLNRCGKSCRLRWLNYLRPDIKHGGFTEEEDAIICNLYYKLGSRWSVIASHLHGRTDNDVKNYWNTKLKKKLMARGTSPSISIPTYGSSPSSPLIPPVAPSPFCSAKEQLVSPSEEISVASSAVTADDGSGAVSYRNDWGGGDDLLLTESDFRLLSDILDGIVGLEDKSSWDSSETLFLPPW